MLFIIRPNFKYVTSFDGFSIVISPQSLDYSGYFLSSCRASGTINAAYCGGLTEGLIHHCDSYFPYIYEGD